MQMIKSMMASASNAIGAGAGHVGNAALGAGIGGVASYANDGSVMKGAMMGAVGGIGGLAMARGGAMKLGMTLGNASPRGTYRRAFASRLGHMGRAASQSTAQQRSALYAGAGLGGMMFGGNNNNHSTGFNAQRGNRI
jgi:hypothetical protein